MNKPDFNKLLAMLFKSHPWHGVSPLSGNSGLVRAYIEIVPSSPVKLELDKETGHLSVDRPQRFSSLCPMLYGCVPQTYCAERVASLCAASTGAKRVKGDGDPLDICVLTEKDFAHGDLFVTARIIGGLRMVDRGQADDKIIAVLEGDIAFGGIREIDQFPAGILERLKHYFLSYKRSPDARSSRAVVSIKEVYGRHEAEKVLAASMDDYKEHFGTAEERLQSLRSFLVEAAKID